MTYKRQGVGPQALGSPLKKLNNPPAGSNTIPEVTVTAKKPSTPPSLKTKIQYGVATGQLKKAPKVKPIMGNPPMVGGGKIATKGFQLAKKAQGALSKYGPKVASAVGDAVEAVGTYKKYKK